MNFFPFVVLSRDGDPFAVRIKNIIRFENREILTNDDGKPVYELVDQSFEEIESRIRRACNISMTDIITEIDGE